jgi:tetratricopeptide (TPR) repeat protein
VEDWEDRAEDFTNDEAAEEKVKPESTSLWQTIRRLFFMFPKEKRAEGQHRLQELTQAIEQYPNTAVNYLLRGELRLDMKEYELAQEDLQKALELAETQFEDDTWGLSAQSTMDRAKHGLQRLV